jgi:predicted nucleic-acid-binding protein
MARTESLDTNAVLRLLLNDAPEQYQAVLALLKREDIRYHIDDLAVAEVAYVTEALYEMDRETVATLLGVLFDEPSVTYNDDVFSKAIPFWVEHPKLSFYDSYLVWAAEIAGRTPYWTFDKKLAAQSNAARLIEPKAKRD